MVTDGISVSGMSEKCLISHDSVITISGPELIKSTAESKPSEAGVRRVCLSMMVVSALLIALMLIISHYEQSSAANGVNDSQSVAGWVAVAGAAIIFGSTGVPMKSPALAKLQVDSFVFALYTSIGIFLVSVPLIVYLLVIEEFEFKVWAVLGAADIVIIGYLAFLAVRMLGYFKAPAIWAGVGMTSAFVWGAIAFKEPIKNVPMAVSAIILLIIGVYAVSTSQASDSSVDLKKDDNDDNNGINNENHFENNDEDMHESNDLEANGSGNDRENHQHLEDHEANMNINILHANTLEASETPENCIPGNNNNIPGNGKMKNISGNDRKNVPGSDWKNVARNDDCTIYSDRNIYPDKEESKEYSPSIRIKEYSSDVELVQIVNKTNEKNNEKKNEKITGKKNN